MNNIDFNECNPNCEQVPQNVFNLDVNRGEVEKLYPIETRHRQEHHRMTRHEELTSWNNSNEHFTLSQPKPDALTLEQDTYRTHQVTTYNPYLKCKSLSRRCLGEYSNR